jgi:gamma-glutamyl hercynylcysteine S-oxide synthase
MGLKEIVAKELEAARQRSLTLVAPVPDEDMMLQHSPLMSPLVWDVAHVGNYEEIWLLRTIAGLPARAPQLDDIYDAFKHARKERTRLKLLGPEASRNYISDVRGRAFDVLEGVEFDPSNPLLNEAYVYGMVIQHEQMHDETMLATLQLRKGQYPISSEAPPEKRRLERTEVRVEGGPFVMGTDTEPWAFDNERPAHLVDLPAFWIDTAPVSNRAFIEFMEAGGYEDKRWWSDEGWQHRTKEGIEHPEFWSRQGRGWSRYRFGQQEELPLDEPVQHISWYEAEAYARWAGKRLPTEAEWEKAASWDSATGTKRRFPWGDLAPSPEHANLNQRYFRPAPPGAYPQGVSPSGCHQMIGDVWEWTSSDFDGHPGYVCFPYREYSEVFFGRDYKVLRGGSWATHPVAIRNTFRNWDFPIRRQIFCGFRCARDA